MSFSSTNHRRRILVLTPSVPYPPNWGFGIRVFQLVKNLAAVHEVVVLCHGHASQAHLVAELSEVAKIEVHAVPFLHESKRAKRIAQLLSAASPISFAASALRSPALQSKIDELHAQKPFDLIHIESSQMSGFRLPSGVPVILDEHNLEYELFYRVYQAERAPLRRHFNRLEYLKFRREEIASWQRADGVILTSAREEAELQRIQPGVATITAPNGVDVENFRPSDEEVDANSIVFTGLMGYRPNADGAIYCVQEILPHILQRRPSTVFSIVGMGAGQEVFDCVSPNVVVTGEVPDVRPYIRKASVVIVPLRMGSGTRLKVLDGLAMGKTMVSTSLGCEGIDVEDGVHLRIADDPRAFAESVVQLLENPESGRALGSAGRRLVEEKYSWPHIAQIVSRFHDERYAAFHARKTASGA